MVSKLSFKGHKKKKSKKKSSINEHEKRTQSSVDEKTFYINGKITKQSEINIEKLTYGWTLLYKRDLTGATHSIINPESGQLPVIITFIDPDRELCLSQVKTADSDSTVKKLLKFTSDFELSKTDDTVNYSEFEISNENNVGRIEPKNVDQVFILSDASSLFQSANKFIESGQKKTVYSIKTTEGEYLVFDPTTNELKLSLTFTEYGLFNLVYELENNIPQFRILIGNPKNEEANTLIISSSGVPKVIPDTEDLLQPISRFILKLRREDAFYTKEILRSFKRNTDALKSDSSTNINGLVKKTILDLSKLGFRITDKTIKEITDAYINGYLNQWIVDFKEKNVSDRRT
jgi:hypothetical protein